MNKVDQRLEIASPDISCEKIPVDYFDPFARKQSKLRVAMMLINCLNSYIKSPLFPCKQNKRRTQ